MPEPQYCLVSGLIYKPALGPTGPVIAPDAALWISPVSIAGTSLWTAGFQSPADNTGLISFRAVRGSTINIRGEVLGWDKENHRDGVNVVVPDAATANLEDLTSVATVPTSGLTVYNEGVPLSGLYGSIDFLGAAINAVEASPGRVSVTVTSTGGITTREVDGAPSFLVSILEFAQADGFVLTDQGSGIGRVNFTGGGGGTWGSITGTLSDQTDLQAALNAKQPLDGELTALAGLISAADRLPYFTGAGTASLATFTQAGRDLVAGVDNTAQRATLGLGNVENTALSTWVGSANITTLGTITTGSFPAANLTGTLADARLSANVPLLNAANVFTGPSNTIAGLRDKGGQVFNVKSYGAVGDGVADDLAALQAAQTAALAAGGGTILLPPGTYGVSNQFAPAANIVIAGSGRKITFMKALAAFPATTAIIQVTNVDHVTVQDIGFIPNAQAMTAVNFTGSENSLLQRCHMAAGFQWTAFIGNTGNPSLNVVIDNIIVDGTTINEAIAIVDSSYCVLRNSYIKVTSANYGIEVYGATAGTVIGTKVEGNTFEGGIGGPSFDGDIGSTCVGNTIFATTQVGIDALPLTGNSIGGTMTGNTIDATLATKGIALFEGAENWTVANNTIRNSAGTGIWIEGDRHNVTGNVVYNSTGTGILVQPTASHNTVSNNTTNNNGRGIDVQGDNNVIIGHNATDTRDPKIQDYGIAFASGADNNHYIPGQLQGNLLAPVLDSGNGNGLIIPGEELAIKGIVGVNGPTETDVALKATRSGAGYVQKWTDGTATGFLYANGAAGVEFGTAGAHQLAFDTNTVQRMRIGAAGGVTIVGTGGNLVVEGTSESSFVGNLLVSGLLKAGSGPTTLTNANGTLRFAALDITGTPNGTKFVRDDGSFQSIPGGGDALVSNPLSQFAATTSLQFKGVISDETGSGLVVFNDTPTLIAPLLGTPTSGVLTNCTGLPPTTGIVGWPANASGVLTNNGSGTLSWTTPGGSGTVTATGGALTANSVVLGAGTTDTKVVAGIITDGVSKVTLGVAGSSVGSVDFKNATSGTVTLAPVTGALGTVTASLQAVTGTLYVSGGTDVPVADGGTGASTLTGLLQGNGTSAITGISNSSTVGQVLRVTGASTYAWGAVDLADTDAVTGTLPVGNGGTGVATFTANGVLYGNAATSILVTAQGAANSILVANAGAPSFSQTPIINTSLQLGVASSVTGLLKLGVSGSANLTTIQAGDTPASAVIYKFPADDPAAGEFLKVTSFGSQTAVLEWATPSGAGTVTHTGGALTANAVIVGAGGDDVVALASLGTSGWVLTSNGAGTPPSFQAASGGAQTPWTANVDADGFSLLVDDGTGIFSSEAGNPELLKFTSVASAVNEFTITNAATGTSPILSATGGDTDIGITLTPKGAGSVAVTPAGTLKNALRVNHSDGTVRLQVGVLGAGQEAYATVWLGDITASSTNYFAAESASGDLAVASSLSTGVIDLRFAGATKTPVRLDASNSLFRLAANYPIVWSDTTDLAYNTIDTGLRRNAAGVVEVNNGTSGQWGALKSGVRDAGTTNVADGLIIGHQSTGTPAAGFGVALMFNLNSSTTADQGAAEIAAVWTDATHATRTSDLIFSTVLSGSLAETFRMKADSSILLAGRSGDPSSPGNGSIWYDSTGNLLRARINGATVSLGAGGANTALSNLASVSINASLIPQSGKDLGAAATAFKDLYLYGSGTFGSHSWKLTGTPTGNRTITLPDSNTTLPISGQQITWSGPTAARTYTFPDANGTVGIIDATQTLTNKRITSRTTTVASSTTSVTIDVSTTDMHITTAQAGALLFNNPTGTPTEGQKLMIRIEDNGTARALTYDTQFRASSDLSLPTTTTLGKVLYMLFIFNATDTRWDLLSKLDNFT